MTRRMLAVGLLAVVGCALHGQVLPQKSGGDATSVVNEAKARAILRRDAIQLRLPLATPAIPGECAIAWLLSPTGASSGQTAEDMVAGSQLATLTLPWPKDNQGKAADQIGWYRVAYRIEVTGSTKASGILAVGAIAPNLLEVRLASPDKLIAGKPLDVRVYAGNPVTRTAFRGVQIVAKLAIDADASSKSNKPKQVIEQATTTDETGEALLHFALSTKPGDTATLMVKGTLTGGSAQVDGASASDSVSKDFDTDDRATIRVETDKPLHKPGETVHMRALVFDDAGRAAANNALTLTIKDPESKTLSEVPLTTNRFGIASYDWKTGTALAPGDYDATFEFAASSDLEGEGMTVVRIQRYELPEFAVTAAMDRGYYLEGQTPVVRVHAGYLFGKPVVAGALRIVRAGNSSWNFKIGKLDASDAPEQTATLDADGNAELYLDVAKDFDEFKGREYQRYSDIEYRAIVTDPSTGRSEPRNFTARLTRNPVHIYLEQIDSGEHEGDYFISTAYADGTPVSAKVTLDWMRGEGPTARAEVINTSRYGLAKIYLRYPPLEKGKDDLGIRLVVRDPEGRDSKLDDTVRPGRTTETWISVAHTLLRPGQPIAATLHGEAGSTIDVDVLTESGLLTHRQVRMTHATEPLTIPAGPAFHGLVTMRAYAMNVEVPEYGWRWGTENQGYKSVLYPEDHSLRVKLTGLKPSYLPGAAVDAGMQVDAAGGLSPSSAVGISVFDTAVEQRATTEEEANDRWFGESWWLDENNAGGVTRQMLDQLDMSRPLPEDLDVAAEMVLRWAQSGAIEIAAADSSNERQEYEATMQKSLKPLSVAVLAVRSVRMPSTMDSLRGIVREAKLTDALLTDPWNLPYKAQTSFQTRDEVLSLVSAGPDKQFGTSDDFTIEVARRNIFAIDGERLMNVLADAAAAGKALPGTLDGLKETARAGGVDLDQLRDPQGKPFKYVILVRRRYYSIEVLSQDGNSVWTSPSIDYFSRTEAKMEDAIRSWVAAGKPFPDSEADARQVFSAAGIDFDRLRDPMGKPFQMRSTQLLVYTRAEQVKAGASLEVKSKPVTHMLRAIQILRTPEPGPEAAPEADLVAQFVHPVTEQSGSDLKPQPVDQGTFKANTGAIGGTVTDQTGAVIANATVTVTSSAGAIVATVLTQINGTYIAPDLASGFYTVKVEAKAFQTFVLREVYVSTAALTGVDAMLSVGASSESVMVEASATSLSTSSSVVATRWVAADRQREVVGPTGRAIITEPTFTPRLRHVFEETAYWAPSLETSSTGRASLQFKLPDSLTTWKLHALASTVDGRVGVIDQTFMTFQPFFVDMDAPQVLTAGDELTLPLNLRNYTDHAMAMPVTAATADWFALLTPSTVHADVASNGNTAVKFRLRAQKAVEAGPLRITAANANEGDAVEKIVRVHPDGEPRSVNTSALVRGATTLSVDLPADMIAGSMHAELRLYPNLGAHIVQSMKAVLERPYGCGEQTISSTYPSLLFLEMLKAAHKDSPAETEAKTYLQLGYDRLQGYFGDGGGLTYWGRSGESGDTALTAYGLEFLMEAEPLLAVDQSTIVGLVNWLVTHQQADGSWKPHYGNTNAELNLYIASVLARAAENQEFANAAPESRDHAKLEVARAVAWAAASAAAVHDPYANALRLRLAADADTTAKLRAELAQSAVHNREGAHWSSARSSPFYGWGLAGELETTSLVLGALGQGKQGSADRALANDALSYILRNQDRYGIWYSGQATVRVLQALMPLAIAQMQAPAAAQDFSVTINGAALTDKDASMLRADRTLMDAPRALDLSTLLKPGHNEVEFRGATEDALASAEASASFYIPWHETATPGQVKTQTGAESGLDFSYVCNADNAHVQQPVECSVSARRFGSGYGMLLAEVGLPPGAEVDRASLARLLDDWTISRYELQPDRIVFYLWSSAAEGEHFSFRFTPRYAIRAKAAEAEFSDYYNPDLKVVLAPQTFAVAEPVAK